MCEDGEFYNEENTVWRSEYEGESQEITQTEHWNKIQKCQEQFCPSCN